MEVHSCCDVDVDVDDDDNLMAMAFDDIKIIVSQFLTSFQCGRLPRLPPHYILICFDSTELKEKLLIIHRCAAICLSNCSRVISLPWQGRCL